ncbi:MAG: 2-oxoacid:ferredoxin oxidoreductase subunit beta [Chloroflexi bacterium]|nr:2-oxoacid:ferredoxin oxidoreductase subunit beta [Chloroflexota bacterium]
MATYREFSNDVPPAWCPGCGNWSIRNATMRALAQVGLEPHQALIVSGIGQASKLPDYLTVNSLTTLHGRPIPIAQGAHLANHEMKVIVHAGDGDTFGLGGNHYIHMMRRNADVALMVHDNLIYGLTKGQYSPTSPKGFLSKTSPKPTGAIEQPVNPLALALTSEATFVARTFAGDLPHMMEMMVAAIEHPGAAVLDILQPCVVFNPQYSFDFYRPRVYKLSEEEGYDTSDREAAWHRAWEWGDRIPIGILYQERRPTYEEQLPVLQEGGAVAYRPFREWTEADYADLEREFL